MTNKESQSVEYKQIWRNDCLKAVSAFANSSGGMLIIGLDDHGQSTGLKNVKKLLAETFYYAGYIEAWGRGTLKIVEQCLENGLPEPDFKAENSVMTVTFYKDKWTEENLKKRGLNDRQIKAVIYVKENGKITNQEYQVICETSNRTATRGLTELVSLKIFQQIGTTGKGTKYVLRRHKDDKDAIKTPKGKRVHKRLKGRLILERSALILRLYLTPM